MKKIKKTTTLLIMSLALLAIMVGCDNSASDLETVPPSPSEPVISNDTASVEDVETSSQIELNSEFFSTRDMESSYDENIATVLNLMDETTMTDSEKVIIDGNTLTILDEGVYVLNGFLSDGQIIIDAKDTDKIQIVLNNVQISNSSSAPIYIKQADKVFITLANNTENQLSVAGEFIAIDDNNIDAAIFSKDDLTINGSGSLTIKNEYGHGITSKDDLVITNGTYDINVLGHGVEGKNSVSIADGYFVIVSGKDGIHSENNDEDTQGTIYIQNGYFNLSVGDTGIQAENLVQIQGGEIDIPTSTEGIEAAYVLINGGYINIDATDDGINASTTTNAEVAIEFNGGDITITMADGDTDAIDSNGNIYINGGTFDLTCGSSFDSDGEIIYEGGTVVVNGETITDFTTIQMGYKGHK